MIDQRTHAGRFLATLGSIILLSAAAALALVFGWTYVSSLNGRTLEALAATTPLPAFASLIWLATVAGTAASIVAIVLYEFRARWFWRCLVATSILWLLAPPAGTVVGLISLVVLITARHHFAAAEEHRMLAS